MCVGYSLIIPKISSLDEVVVMADIIYHDLECFLDELLHGSSLCRALEVYTVWSAIVISWYLLMGYSDLE